METFKIHLFVKLSASKMYGKMLFVYLQATELRKPDNHTHMHKLRDRDKLRRSVKAPRQEFSDKQPHAHKHTAALWGK